MKNTFFCFFCKLKDFKKSRANYNSEPYEFSASVKGAAINTLTVCGFVVLFSAVCGIISETVRSDAIFSLLSPFIEVTCASSFLSRSIFLPRFITLLLTSYAISFSGFSVHLQASAFLRGTDISMKKYYCMKLLQGLFSVIFTLILTAIA